MRLRPGGWRHHALALGLYVLASLGGCTGQAAPGAAEDVRSHHQVSLRPHVRVAGPTHVSKGTVPVHEHSVADFVLVNETDEVVELRLLRKTCPCLDVTLPDGSAQLGARARTTISLAMFAPPVAGVQQHRALFWAGRPGSQPDFEDASEDGHLIELGLALVPALDFWVRPMSLDDITGGAGEPFSRRVRIWRFGGGDLRLVGITPLDLPIEPTFNTEPDDEGAVWITMDARHPSRPGVYVGTIQVLIAGDARSDDMDHTVVIPVSLRVVPRGYAVPAGAMLRLDAADAAAPVSRIAHIEIHDAAGGGPLRAECVGRTAGLAAELTPNAMDAGRWTLRVRVDPALVDARAGADRVEVLDAHGNVVAEVPVAWRP
ncbi:MAG: hypothetical protein KF817_08580 [Phycisphaeraceae bacterium]|nr:hypothetical protein [Phycisphaeraceae bacterium]